MRTQWKKIVVKITCWLIVEIILNLLGLDNLADYSEFVFEEKSLILNNPVCEIALAIWLELEHALSIALQNV